MIMNLTDMSIPGIGLASAGASSLTGLFNQSLELPNVLKTDSFASVLDTQQSSPSAINGSTTKTEKQIREAARGFERTLIRQMLSTVRSNALRGGDEQTEASKGYLEIADDKLADSLVAGKGIGFATKLADQLLAQPKVKALIDTEKKTVSSTNNSDLTNNINRAVNQYKNASSF